MPRIRISLATGIATLAIAVTPAVASADPELSPSEEATADALIIPAPNVAVDATIVPADCQTPDLNDPASCAYTVHAAPAAQASTSLDPAFTDPAIAPTPADTRSKAKPVVMPLHGATVKHLKYHRRKISKATGGRASSRVTGMRAWWVINDDHTCSPAGCWAWEFQLNSKAYCDGTYAWGSRSRFGYAGYANDDGTKSNTLAIDEKATWNGDPSRNDLFAGTDGRVWAGPWQIGPNYTHYVHRHYPGNCGNAWLVTG